MFRIFYQACIFYAPEDILTRIADVDFRTETAERVNQTEKKIQIQTCRDILAWKIISKEGVGLVFQTAFLFAHNHWNFIPRVAYFLAITILRCANGRVSQTFSDASLFLSLAIEQTCVEWSRCREKRQKKNIYIFAKRCRRRMGKAMP